MEELNVLAGDRSRPLYRIVLCDIRYSHCVLCIAHAALPLPVSCLAISVTCIAYAASSMQRCG
eukprot:2174565-Rhodomonas_salina.3